MAYRLLKSEDTLKITLLPEVTLDDLKSIAEEVEKSEGINKVKLDLRKCEYIQSKTLAGFIQLHKICKKKNQEFVLVNVSESVKQLLELTNLLSVFKIDNDFSSYSPEEVVEFFEDIELADKVSDYIADNYNDEFKKVMAKLIKNEDPILKEYAIITIGKAHDYDFIDEVRAALNEDVGNVVKAAITVLGWFQDFESKEKIYPYLKSEFIDVAEAAAATIALLADENDSEKLSELLKEDDERLKKIAVQALTLINDDKSYDTIKNELKKETNEFLVAYYVKMLSFFNKDEVGDILISYLEHPSNLVRETAAASLVRIKAVSKIDEILKKITDSDSMVGYFATKAIGELCDEKRCADYLMEVYHKVSENVKLAIIEALGKMKADCSDFLYQALSEENDDIRKEALNSLFKILGKKVKDIAVESLQDNSWMVRYKAVEILGSIEDDDVIDILKNHLEKEDNKYIKEKIYSVLGEL